MHAQDVFVPGGLRPQKVACFRDAVAQQLLGDQTELLRRENVGAKIQVVAVVINQLERQHGRCAQLSRCRIKSGTAASARPSSDSPCPFRQALARRAYSWASFRARSSAPDPRTGATSVSDAPNETLFLRAPGPRAPGPRD